MDNRPRISIVIPFFNEEETLPALWDRLDAVVRDVDAEVEFVWVDDGSSDGTLAKLKELAAEDHRVRVIALSRNFGHQPALTAGVDHATGDAIIVMDGDLQDRPEAIADFLDAWRDGYEVVYAIRESRQEGPISRALFTGFYRVVDALSGLNLPPDAGVFGLLDRRVVDVLKNMPERNRYFPGLRAYAGFRQTGVNVPRDSRHAGAPRVGFIGLVKLAFDGILSFSYIPIRLITWSGLLVALFALGYILVILYKKFVISPLDPAASIPGWASILTAILLLGGLQLVTLGIIGEYVGRIYEEAKQRPYYIIRETIGPDD